MKIIFVYKTQKIIGSQKLEHPGKQILVVLINFIPGWNVPELFW